MINRTKNRHFIFSTRFIQKRFRSAFCMFSFYANSYVHKVKIVEQC